MRVKIFLVLALVILTFAWMVVGIPPGDAIAHGVAIPVIVDTDAALDDMRALALLLQDGHFEIRAIVTSDGACAPPVGADKIARALEFMGRGEIPVGVGRSLGLPSPPWREISESFGGLGQPTPPERSVFRGAIETINRALDTAGDPTGYRQEEGGSPVNGRRVEDMGITYICLGPLTNLADALRSDPSLVEKITALYYYGRLEELEGVEPSWNTSRDPRSARAVAASGLSVYSCSLPDSDLLIFDRALFNEVTAFDGRGSELIRLLHSGEKISKLLDAGHFRAWDETVVLCLIDPLLTAFSRKGEAASSYENIHTLTFFDSDGARRAYLEIFRQGGSSPSPAQSRKTVVFERFPDDPGLMRSDIRSIMADLIRLHGIEEWRAAVLTNEIHRHLGIYSILGVKMGLRARELLDSTLDDLRVVSRAGLEPPLSCMNDGLQVSTGASLGRGTISIDTGKSPVPDLAGSRESGPLPEALFIMGGDSLILRLKPSVVGKIKNDIGAAIKAYGNLTPEYFSEIRRLSLRYWLEMDRREIFEIF